jgi:PA domain-containing protein
MRKALILTSFALTLAWAVSASAAILEQISPAPTTYVQQVDFAVFDFSAIGDVTASLVGVNVSSPSSGCVAGDFAGFTAGSIALMQRGTCAFDDKAANAAAAGAVGGADLQ